MATYYQLLGIGPQAKDEEIKRAYRRLAMQYHPDKNKAPDANQRFREIQNAYDVLMDYASRSQYDQMLNAGYSTSYSSNSTASSHDTRFDPFTGKRNKYYRGKPREERDLDVPFDNFVKTNVKGFEPDFDSLGRITILGIPGFLFCLFFPTPLLLNNSPLDVGDALITLPFLLFHCFVIIDSLLPSNEHYALLTRVNVDNFSKWKELFVRVTTNSATSHLYHQISNKDWYKDRMYLYDSPIDLSEVQQFIIYKSPIFKVKLAVKGIVKEKLLDLSINKYKSNFLLLFSLLQVVFLLVFFNIEMHSFVVFATVFGIQVLHIYMFMIHNTLSERNNLRYILHWFE